MEAPPLEYSGMGGESVVETRRARLRKVIGERYRGIQANMVRDTGINAGELSGLLKTRFFGEKKARTLEKALGLPDMWFDGAEDETGSAALDDFRLALELADQSERSILLSTVSTIINTHKKDERTTELSVIRDRRKGA